MWGNRVYKVRNQQHGTVQYLCHGTVPIVYRYTWVGILYMM